MKLDYVLTLRLNTSQIGVLSKYYYNCSQNPLPSDVHGIHEDIMIAGLVYSCILRGSGVLTTL